MASMEPLPELTRSSLRDQARRVLRTQIITGQLVEGRLYSVGDFAHTLGVSATPVREALADLAQQGLVEVIRNRGFQVVALTSQDLDEILHLRIMLEVPAVERAIDLVDFAQLAEYEALVDRGYRCAVERDLAGFLDADREFHLKLLATTGNRRLVEIVDRLRDQSRLYGLVDLTVDRLVEASSEHRDLLRAIQSKDRDAARACLIYHLEHTRGLWAGLTES